VANSCLAVEHHRQWREPGKWSNADGRSRVRGNAGYPHLDIRSTYSRRAFSSRGVRYCWLAALSLSEGLPLAWRHNVDLLGCDDTGSVFYALWYCHVRLWEDLSCKAQAKQWRHKARYSAFQASSEKYCTLQGPGENTKIAYPQRQPSWNGSIIAKVKRSMCRL
jgi:hypothetical protein